MSKARQEGVAFRPREGVRPLETWTTRLAGSACVVTVTVWVQAGTRELTVERVPAPCSRPCE